MIHGDDVALSPGCMWRTWTRSRGQRAPVFVMTSSSALSFHSDSEKDEKKNPKKSCRNNDARPPPPPLPHPPSRRSSFQIQPSVILFWALRAKHLLRFVSPSSCSPGGAGGSQQRNRRRNAPQRPAAGARFHYLKAPESTEQKEM